MFGLRIVSQVFLDWCAAQQASLLARVAQQDGELDKLRRTAAEVEALKARLAEGQDIAAKLDAELAKSRQQALALQAQIEAARKASRDSAVNIPGVVLPPDVRLSDPNVFDAYKQNWLAEETEYWIGRGLSRDLAIKEAEKQFRLQGRPDKPKDSE